LDLYVGHAFLDVGQGGEHLLEIALALVGALLQLTALFGKTGLQFRLDAFALQAKGHLLLFLPLAFAQNVLELPAVFEQFLFQGKITRSHQCGERGCSRGDYGE